MTYRIIEIGNKYGMLEIVEFLGSRPTYENSKNISKWYKCKCQCGGYIDLPAAHMGFNCYTING